MRRYAVPLLALCLLPMAMRAQQHPDRRIPTGGWDQVWLDDRIRKSLPGVLGVRIVGECHVVAIVSDSARLADSARTLLVGSLPACGSNLKSDVHEPRFSAAGLDSIAALVESALADTGMQYRHHVAMEPDAVFVTVGKMSDLKRAQPRLEREEAIPPGVVMLTVVPYHTEPAIAPRDAYLAIIRYFVRRNPSRRVEVHRPRTADALTDAEIAAAGAVSTSEDPPCNSTRELSVYLSAPSDTVRLHLDDSYEIWAHVQYDREGYFVRCSEGRCEVDPTRGTNAFLAPLVCRETPAPRAGMP